VKALLASASTALVLVSVAWASNVTPAQLTALSARVAKLEKENSRLERITHYAAQDQARTQAHLLALASRLSDEEALVATDERSFDRLAKCLSFTPATQYSFSFVSVYTYPLWGAPQPNTGPQFWVPTTTDQSCLTIQSP
jgi:hypothetical protein